MKDRTSTRRSLCTNEDSSPSEGEDASNHGKDEDDEDGSNDISSPSYSTARIMKDARRDTSGTGGDKDKTPKASSNRSGRKSVRSTESKQVPTPSPWNLDGVSP